MGTRNRGQAEPAIAFEELSLEGKTDRKTDHIQMERHVKLKLSQGAVEGKIKGPDTTRRSQSISGKKCFLR